MNKILICKKCGAMVEVLKPCTCRNCGIVCCDTPMTELIPNTSDGAGEKHLPVYKIEGNKVSVQVGSVLHPMTNEHYIEWIMLCTDKGSQKLDLMPGAEPRGEFLISQGEKVEGVYAYCNLHGLWKS